ncbi:MAG: alpha/beta hydrolase [Rhodospirillales bacterium]|nr:alpha/beta hydrolase [Rhodospirillales bacterium]MDH3912000.1 alpha/beta hydrolase [Rhodospirillales bacterium]MDH3917024.1 alpha/beta hydrolase [Rhodospirillales bacterium]MDH3966625.1 alpha/beta hydrolase [Rhodospirillales bacterium]
MTQKLYRGYDQAELDGQLNLRARWPEHEEYFARWAEDSAEVRRQLGDHVDLAYGPSAGQKLDLFLPEGAAGSPLLAFIHGGYWQSLDKSDFSYLAPPYLEKGIAFASLNYDLAPQVGVAEILRQVRCALAWLYRNAADYGVDPGRIYLAGHSAGGHLSAMALATDWQADPAVGPGLPGDLVKGGCSVSGVYDMEPIRLSYHQAVLDLDAETAARMTPLHHLPPRAVPLILAVGSEETDEFHRQQGEYLAAWQTAGLTATVVELPGRNHFTAVDALGEHDHSLFAATSNLMLTGA